MLLKFYCSNFKSIKDEIAFSLFAGNYKRHENHLIEFNGKQVLRTSAIYGTNGSGKTNILFALQFMHRIITRGTRDINEKLNIPIFKLSDCKNIPTKFEIDFIKEKKRFNYQIELLQDKILREELYEVRENSEIIIFKRKVENNKTILTIAPNRNKDQKEKIREQIYSEELRDNQSFLKEGVNKKIAEFNLPYTWFSENLRFVSLDNIGREANGFQLGLASTFLLDQDFFDASIKIIREANVGISNIKLTEYSLADLKVMGVQFPLNIENELQTKPEMNVDFVFNGDLFSSVKKNGDISFVKITTSHISIDNSEIEFKFSEESKGVQRLFELLPAIYRSIHKGEVFIIDEIETSFHPVLIKEIITLYLDSSPQKSGQLIFTTHESHLLDLDLFRQDEIWFCEKDNFGSTKLYSLAEFKPRFDKDIRKGYFEGQFSFIPFLGDKNQLGL